ncbi:MAG: hypothetical protein LBM39_03550 [Candidatus Methanoplasma sp.]|jgi:hypothetical protein|nr:hypothetical protein [Candidatus Methanoplasma sp.]
MGISIGISEIDAKSALCRELKVDIIKVRAEDPSQFGDLAEYDEVVSLDEARSIIKDWDAFVKRNRFNTDSDAVYIDKLKNEDDISALRKASKRVLTGWIDLSKADPKERSSIIDSSKKENRLTGWDLVSFDEMNETCAKCPVSWDKGRGCIGAFGPDNSLLPEIAGRRGCKIVASVPEGAKTGRKYTPKDAEELLKEIPILTAALPEEGKVMVRRYAGPLERLEAVAKISVSEGCGFFFF